MELNIRQAQSLLYTFFHPAIASAIEWAVIDAAMKDLDGITFASLIEPRDAECDAGLNFYVDDADFEAKETILEIARRTRDVYTNHPTSSEYYDIIETIKERRQIVDALKVAAMIIEESIEAR